MKIVSIINYKGGVGKTTVTANLAGELGLRGKKVLLLDMDAQSSLTFSFVTPDYWENNLKENKTIKSWFDYISREKEKSVSLDQLLICPGKVNQFFNRRSTSGSIDLISSHLGLINVDLNLATLLGGANMNQTKINYLKIHGELRSALQQLVKDRAYDVVLIDCPPNFNIVTKNALIASDKILVPAKPDYLSTLGIDYLKASVDGLVREFNQYAEIDHEIERTNPQSLGVVFTMIQYHSGQPIAAQRQYISQTRRSNFPIMAKMFRENKTIFADAPQSGLPVVLKKFSSNSHSNVVDEIKDFVDEFVQVSGI